MATDTLQDYEYTAFDSQGKRVSGTRAALKQGDIHEYLRRENMTPVKISSPKGGKITTGFKGKLPKSVEIADFMREFQIFIGASIPEKDALAAIIEGMAPDTRFYNTIVDVRKRVLEGEKLHDAMAHHQEIFSPGVTSALKSGHIKGKLPATLREIADRLEEENALAAQVRKALTSPILEIVALIGAMIFMVVGIVPQISDFYRQMAGPNAALPPVTQFMVVLSGALPYLALPTIGGGILAFGWYRRNKNRPEIKAKFDEFYSKIPVVGALLREVALTRFCRDMAGHLSSGIEINMALTIAADTVNNAQMSEIILIAAKGTEEGQALSDILKEHEDMFPHTLTAMVKGGETSGRLPEMFIHLTKKYDESAKRKSDGLAAAIAPFTKVGMGVAVGFLAMAVLLPLFSIAGQVQL